MTDKETFLAHLQHSDWERLFSLLPELMATKNWGTLKGGDRLKNGDMTFHYWEPSALVHKTVHTLRQLNILPDFDWANWEEGKTLLRNKDFDYTTLDKLTLCKLLSLIVCADRFNEGFLVKNFQNGTATRIIKAIQQKVLLG